MRSRLLVRFKRVPAQYAQMRICACGHMLSPNTLMFKSRAYALIRFSELQA